MTRSDLMLPVLEALIVQNILEADRVLALAWTLSINVEFLAPSGAIRHSRLFTSRTCLCSFWATRASTRSSARATPSRRSSSWCNTASTRYPTPEYTVRCTMYNWVRTRRSIILAFFHSPRILTSSNCRFSTTTSLPMYRTLLMTFSYYSQSDL